MVFTPTDNSEGRDGFRFQYIRIAKTGYGMHQRFENPLNLMYFIMSVE